MKQAAVNMDVLANPENLKILSNVLKTNVSAATSIGPFFTPQLGRIYMDMLGLYRAVSGIISETVAREGTHITKPSTLNLNTDNATTHDRHHRNQNAESAPPADDQERDPQARGDVH